MSSDHVDKFLLRLSSSLVFQVLVLFPCLVLCCYVFGFFAVWVALMGSGGYYVIVLHKTERERFHRSYLWTLRTLIDNRNEIPSDKDFDIITKGVGGAGETVVIENLATLWWKTSSRKLFQHTILETLIESLNENVAATNSIISEFTAGQVRISSDSPKLLSLQCSPSSYNSLYQDMKWEYHGDTVLPFYVTLGNSKISISIQDIKFIGTIRLETIFPQSEYVEGATCKEQEKYTMAVSIIDEYLLDFDIVASNIKLAGIPVLRKWIHNTIHEKIKSKVVWPYQIRLFGPSDHVYRHVEHPTVPLGYELDNALTSEIEGNEIETKERKSYITAISIFFPDGENNSPPEGFELLDRTCSGNYAANLNSGSSNQRAVYICTKKNSVGIPVTDIAAVREDRLDDLPEEYRLIRMTNYGEDAFISFHEGESQSKIYLCYEKGHRQKGYLEDIKVMFSEEIARVRELKARNQNKEIDEFPIGYTMLKIHSVPQNKGASKNIYLCLKRVGGTKLKSLVKDPENTPKRNSALFSKLQSITSLAVSEVKEISRVHGEKKKKELESIGITPILIEAVSHLSEHPEIFQNYPLEGRQPKEDFFVMNDLQQKHAIQILKAVPKLGEARRQLAPSFMSDSAFWYVYFSYIKNSVL